MPENKIKTKGNEVIIKNLSKDLSEKEVLTLVSLMKKGRLKDEELMGILGMGSPNAASYYRKKLEEKGVIKGYAAEIDWGKLGYTTEFFVITEGSDIYSMVDIERNHIISTAEYMDTAGEIIIIPTGMGKVILSEVCNCFGEKNIAMIHGYATSDHDAAMYSRGYVSNRYPGAKTTLITVKYSSILHFFIQKEIVNSIKDSLTMTREDKATLEDFRKKFPWEKLGIKKDD